MRGAQPGDQGLRKQGHRFSEWHKISSHPDGWRPWPKRELTHSVTGSSFAGSWNDEGNVQQISRCFLSRILRFSHLVRWKLVGSLWSSDLGGDLLTGSSLGTGEQNQGSFEEGVAGERRCSQRKRRIVEAGRKQFKDFAGPVWCKFYFWSYAVKHATS